MLADGGDRFGFAVRQDDAFASRQPIRLDHQRPAEPSRPHDVDRAFARRR